ncbi:hypothetical protein WP3W18E06_P60500 (plasmid) [Raoultella ornithinolytica]|nr:hypothetical protein WP3W18E06_P60500 [Raoultella ornithinolytica]
MKGVAFGIILSLIPLSSMAADCFDMAGRDYKIDPDLLRAISWQESRFKIDAIGRNPVTGYGSGLMQIDSQHFNELSRYGINRIIFLAMLVLTSTPEPIIWLRRLKSGAFRGMQSGHTMQASKKTPRQAARRYEYAKKIHYYYRLSKQANELLLKIRNRHRTKKPSDIRSLNF